MNFTGTVVLCQMVAERLAARGGGTICAFSSVAGDRARRSNYLYGASKAGLSAFLEGLGQHMPIAASASSASSRASSRRG